METGNNGAGITSNNSSFNLADLMEVSTTYRCKVCPFTCQQPQEMLIHLKGASHGLQQAHVTSSTCAPMSNSIPNSGPIRTPADSTKTDLIFHNSVNTCNTSASGNIVLPTNPHFANQNIISTLGTNQINSNQKVIHVPGNMSTNIGIMASDNSGVFQHVTPQLQTAPTPAVIQTFDSSEGIVQVVINNMPQAAVACNATPLEAVELCNPVQYSNLTNQASSMSVTPAPIHSFGHILSFPNSGTCTSSAQNVQFIPAQLTGNAFASTQVNNTPGVNPVALINASTSTIPDMINVGPTNQITQVPIVAGHNYISHSTVGSSVNVNQVNIQTCQNNVASAAVPVVQLPTVNQSIDLAPQQIQNIHMSAIQAAPIYITSNMPNIQLTNDNRALNCPPQEAFNAVTPNIEANGGFVNVLTSGNLSTGQPCSISASACTMQTVAIQATPVTADLHGASNLSSANSVPVTACIPQKDVLMAVNIDATDAVTNDQRNTIDKSASLIHSPLKPTSSTSNSANNASNTASVNSMKSLSDVDVSSVRGLKATSPTTVTITNECTDVTDGDQGEAITAKELFLCGQCSAGFSSIDECRNHIFDTHSILNIDSIDIPRGESEASHLCQPLKTSIGIQVGPSKRGRPKNQKQAEIVRPSCIESPIPEYESDNDETKIDDDDNDDNYTPGRRRSSRKRKKPAGLRRQYFTEKCERVRHQNPNGILDGYKLPCTFPHCYVKFKTEHNLMLHELSHNKDDIFGFTCPECHTEFPRWRHLQLHLWKTHEIDIDLLCCDHCDFKTDMVHKLLVHKQIHSDKRPYICKICNKGFKQASQFNNHVTHVHKDKSILAPTEPCSTCGRVFANAKCLKIHVETVHQKLKVFHCSFCSHTTNRKAMLDMHERSHTGEKPYKCDVCTYATGDHNCLRNHKMRHTGERPYQCSLCSYRSIQAVALKAHIKNKHSATSRVLSCGTCNFKTLNLKLFEFHMSDHDKGLISNEPLINNISVANRLKSGKLSAKQDRNKKLEESSNTTPMAVNVIQSPVARQDETIAAAGQIALQVATTVAQNRNNNVIQLASAELSGRYSNLLSSNLGTGQLVYSQLNIAQGQASSSSTIVPVIAQEGQQTMTFREITKSRVQKQSNVNVNSSSALPFVSNAHVAEVDVGITYSVPLHQSHSQPQTFTIQLPSQNNPTVWTADGIPIQLIQDSSGDTQAIQIPVTIETNADSSEITIATAHIDDMVDVMETTVETEV